MHSVTHWAIARGGNSCNLSVELTDLWLWLMQNGQCDERYKQRKLIRIRTMEHAEGKTSRSGDVAGDMVNQPRFEKDQPIRKPDPGS